jgi:hypothetical protein
MAAPLEDLSKVRTSPGSATARRQPPAGSAGSAAPIYAPAYMKELNITERYFVEQEISKNQVIRNADPDIDPEENPPAGQIDWAVPYDGREFLTRQAWDEIAKAQRQRTEPGSAHVVIGQLKLEGYARTDLDATFGLHQRNEFLPIEIQVQADHQGPGQFGYLIADRLTSVTTHAYSPARLDDVPVRLTIKLLDPDSLDLSTVELGDPPSAGQILNVINKMTRRVSFKNELVLYIEASLTIPKVGRRPSKVELSQVTIGWPTITSLRTLRLEVEKIDQGAGDEITLSEVSVRYNPIGQCLEWESVPMKVVEENDDMCEYRSAAMLLSIEHPAELYEQAKLQVHATADVHGYLLSGLQASLYDARGQIQETRSPTLLTSVSVHAELILHDAFAKRDFSPVQQLFFDEIIPDAMRITDIETALRDRGFSVKPYQLPDGYGQSDTPALWWFLVANRPQGPDRLDLWIYVEGRKFQTEREKTAVEGGGLKYTTLLDSGDLRIFARGRLAGDSAVVTRELNALHRALRERYDRVRHRR